MIYFLAPAYNEEENLPELAQSINRSVKKGYKLIIVNDGSTDKTFETAQKLKSKYPIIPLGYKKNQGSCKICEL